MKPPEDPVLLKEIEDEFAQKKFQDFKWTDNYIEEFIKYCAGKNVPVLLVWMPVHPVWSQNFEKYSPYSIEEVNRRIHRLISRYPNVWYYDLHTLDPNTDHYYNLTHLNAAGAIQVTDQLAKIISSSEMKNVITRSQNVQ